eukprot:TRINITY_DN1757_c0_g2_i1.p2 TRINITY_DN1757_c0_g2~~TRINITY_DN1757_c0_g2_i1.p2  ORF type:complete len:124 (+),score=28.86 TRINITY_DN1757_c0_g2_i1:173-544(+)
METASCKATVDELVRFLAPLPLRIFQRLRLSKNPLLSTAAMARAMVLLLAAFLAFASMAVAQQNADVAAASAPVELVARYTKPWKGSSDLLTPFGAMCLLFVVPALLIPCMLKCKTGSLEKLM